MNFLSKLFIGAALAMMLAPLGFAQNRGENLDRDALRLFIDRHMVATEGTEDIGTPSVNLTFVRVGLRDNPDAEVFRRLVGDLLPLKTPLNYMELGAGVGDQGFALRIMAIGDLLDIWEVLTPESMFSTTTPEKKLMLAEKGYIAIKTLDCEGVIGMGPMRSFPRR